LENLLNAWSEFVIGKSNKKDVAEFSLHLMDNLILLNKELKSFTYCHGGYSYFKVNDPKPRDIHKATVRDRLVHHAMHRILYPYFDNKFIYDSYSSRRGKGTHKAIDRFRKFFFKVSRNNHKTCWVLKCDVKKFFASISHSILLRILSKYVTDISTLWLLKEVISSFSSKALGVGLPLGNLTSQLLVNVYLNELDQFIKYKLGVRSYIRFADDFVVLSDNGKYLEDMLSLISEFLEKRLKLVLHPNKVSISTFASGVDFLGIINFPHHRIIRTKTKRCMFARMKGNRKSLDRGLIGETQFNQSYQSYLGLLKYNNSYNLRTLLSRYYK